MNIGDTLTMHFSQDPKIKIGQIFYAVSVSVAETNRRLESVGVNHRFALHTSKYGDLFIENSDASEKNIENKNEIDMNVCVFKISEYDRDKGTVKMGLV
jgi:hypothetical protein